MQRLLRALGATADGVFVMNARQRIVYWNKGAEKLLGYSQAEVLKRPCYEVLAGACCGKPWCHANCKVLRWVLRRVLPDAFDLLTRTKEKSEIWVNVSTVLLPGRNKPMIAHSLRDITHQKRNEEAIENMLSTLDAPDFRKSNSQCDRCAPQSFICKENGLSSLTRREVEVLSLLTRGLSNKEIAQRLAISPMTVRNHVQNALPKLGARSKAQAISFAFANGVLQ